jgi:hypothetical protein
METINVKAKIAQQIQHMLHNSIITDRRFLDDEQLIRAEQLAVLEEIFNANVRDAEINELSSHFAPILRGDHPVHLAIWGKTGTGKTLTVLYFLAAEQAHATPLAPRTTKDLLEEALFARRRDLFTTFDLVFFDTTSIYFEGEGVETLGENGYSRDHRPDLHQMVVAAVLDGEGHPVCCELWPGNTTDTKTLLPVVDRLRGRFGIRSICIVADRGMVSEEVIRGLGAEARDVRFILGMRLRRSKEVRDEVLARGGRYHEVRGPRQRSKDPSPLKVKEVWVGDHRYIVCLNEEEARKDARDREAIVASLRDKLARGEKGLVASRGDHRFLRTQGQARFAIDEDAIRAAARYDGKWGLRTDTDLGAAEGALKYKELWQVERLFRSVKSLLATRPIFHKCDETIRGHVFCSFLALVLLKDLEAKLEARGWTVEWERLKRDLDDLQRFTLETRGKRFQVRTAPKGDAGKALQAAGVALWAGPAALRRRAMMSHRAASSRGERHVVPTPFCLSLTPCGRGRSGNAV